MHLLRRLFSTITMVLAISILFVGCKAKDSTAGLEQTAELIDIEPMPEGYNRASQREQDLNISIRLPKGERGSKVASGSMKIQNRVGDEDDFQYRDDTEDDVFEMIPADVNRDYTVNILDLLAVINEYAEICPASPGECPTDIDKDARTGVGDLVMVISSWGESIEPPPVAEAEEEEESGSSIAENSSELITPDPIALDSLYYDFYARNQERAQLAVELDQAALTRGWNTKNDIPVLPYVYNGAVDWYCDNEYTESDLEKFEEWLDANIPYDYTGPICLDMEGDWWPQFDWVSSQEQMDVILDFYIEGLEYAQAMRPNAKFGYWGLPKKNQTGPNYTGPSIERLLRACGAIFPDTYEDNPGSSDAARLERHIERAMEMVDGRIPVHVQMSPRYRDDELGGWRHFHEIDEIIRDQARPALDATYQSDRGVHRVASIGLWDAYVYVRYYHDDWWSLTMEEIDELWTEVDEYHNAVYVAIAEVVAEYATKDDEDSDSDGPGIGGGKQNKTAAR